MSGLEQLIAVVILVIFASGMQFNSDATDETIVCFASRCLVNTRSAETGQEMGTIKDALKLGDEIEADTEIESGELGW